MKISTSLFALAVLSSTLCLSQSVANRGQRSSVIATEVKPDMVNEWMAIQKNELNPVLKKAGINKRNVSRAVFGNTNEFISISPMDSRIVATGRPMKKAENPIAQAFPTWRLWRRWNRARC